MRMHGEEKKWRRLGLKISRDQINTGGCVPNTLRVIAMCTLEKEVAI